jgi:sulfoxide reductase heme-binding subunit YedZ
MKPTALLPRLRKRIHWLQVVVHTGVWIPLIVLVRDFLTDNLTVNPIQEASQRTGNIAIILLALSLACTPVNMLFRFSPVIKVRRALGLYAYMYAAIHFLIFAGLDYGFNLELILQTIAEKRFIVVGFTALLLLTVLAATSFRWWMVKLGKNWKRLHRVVYLVNLLVVLHFAWAVKGDLVQLQGDILRPLLAGLAVATLLILRLPPVRKRLTGLFRPALPPGMRVRIVKRPPAPEAIERQP